MFTVLLPMFLLLLASLLGLASGINLTFGPAVAAVLSLLLPSARFFLEGQSQKINIFVKGPNVFSV